MWITPLVVHVYPRCQNGLAMTYLYIVQLSIQLIRWLYGESCFSGSYSLLPISCTALLRIHFSEVSSRFQWMSANPPATTRAPIASAAIMRPAFVADDYRIRRVPQAWINEELNAHGTWTQLEMLMSQWHVLNPIPSPLSHLRMSVAAHRCEVWPWTDLHAVLMWEWTCKHPCSRQHVGCCLHRRCFVCNVSWTNLVLHRDHWCLSQQSVWYSHFSDISLLSTIRPWPIMVEASSTLISPSESLDCHGVLLLLKIAVVW
jgi:hypothetical protein